MKLTTQLSSIALLALSLPLSACSSWGWNSEDNMPGYKVTIVQGNELTQTQLDQIQIGMNKDEVKTVLGNPLLENPFHGDTWYYSYAVTYANKFLRKSNLVLHFKGDSLASISGKAQAYSYLDQ